MKTFERRENFRLAAITLFRASIVIMLLVTAVDVYTEISKGDGWTGLLRPLVTGIVGILDMIFLVIALKRKKIRLMIVGFVLCALDLALSYGLMYIVMKQIADVLSMNTSVILIGLVMIVLFLVLSLIILLRQAGTGDEVTDRCRKFWMLPGIFYMLGTISFPFILWNCIFSIEDIKLLDAYEGLSKMIFWSCVWIALSMFFYKLINCVGIFCSMKWVASPAEVSGISSPGEAGGNPSSKEVGEIQSPGEAGGNSSTEEAGGNFSCELVDDNSAKRDIGKKKAFAIWISVSVAILVIVYLAVQFIWQAALGDISDSTVIAKFTSNVAYTAYYGGDVTEEVSYDVWKRSKLNERVIYTSNDNREDTSLINRLLSSGKSMEYALLIGEDMPKTPLSSGNWAAVYTYNENDEYNLDESYITKVFGLINVNELADKGCANEICLDYVDGCSVAVDKYAIKGLEIIPLHIIIYEKEKIINEYTPYAESDIPEGFEIVEGNEVRVETAWLYKENLSDTDLLNVAKKTAEKTAESIDFKNYVKTGDEVAYIKTGADGFWVSNVCYDICEAADGKKYAGIYVWETDILPTFIYFSLIPFVCWTVSFAVIVFAFRKRKLKNES